MQFVLALMHVLDAIFFLGLAGSSIVVIYSFVEDTMELFAKDEPPSGQPTVTSVPPATPATS